MRATSVVRNFSSFHEHTRDICDSPSDGSDTPTIKQVIRSDTIPLQERVAYPGHPDENTNLPVGHPWDVHPTGPSTSLGRSLPPILNPNYFLYPHYPIALAHPSSDPLILAPVPHRPAPAVHTLLLPNIEYPLHEQYLAVRSQELAYEAHESALTQELYGNRVVPVHGVGLWACSSRSNPAREELKQSVWRNHGSRESWLASATARTAYYSCPGVVRPPLRWVLINDGSIPSDALQTGTESTGEKLYSSRAWFEGGLHLGKAAHHLQGGASLPYGSLEHPMSTYEILVGDPSYARWILVSTRSPLTLDALPEYGEFQPIEGGRELSGTSLFIAQGQFERGWHPGKAALGEDHCCIGYGGGEVWGRSFRILAWAGEHS